MAVFKIVGLIGLALAVLAAFVTVPQAAALLGLCGAIVGWSAPADSHVRVIASAIALHLLAGTFDAVPTVGTYVTTIIANIGAVLAGAAILIILRNIYNRLRS